MRRTKELVNIVIQIHKNLYNDESLRCQDGGTPFWMHGTWAKCAKDMCRETDIITEETYKRFLNELYEAHFNNDAMATHIVMGLEDNPPKYIKVISY